MATYINEFGEIIRDTDPNDKSKKKLSIGEGLMIFFANFFTLFFISIFLFFNYRSKGYTKKSWQTCNITWMTVAFFVIAVIISAIVSEL